MLDKRCLEDKIFSHPYLYVRVHESSVHISAAKIKLFYFCWGFFVEFYAIKEKHPRDFVWVIVQLFLCKSCGQRLKEQNIPLLYYTAMPSGCRSGAFVLLLSNQLHILETPAPTPKSVPAVTPWNTGEHIHCKTRCPPRQLPCF